MQAQLVKKPRKTRSTEVPKQRKLRIAELLHEEHRKVNKYYSGSSSSSLNDRPASAERPMTVTSSPHDSSNDDDRPKGLAYRKKKLIKRSRIKPAIHTHAVCLNHITAHPYCSVDVNEMFNLFPKYYKTKQKYVLRWLRRNFGRMIKPKRTTQQPSSSNSNTSSSESSDSSSDSDDDSTDTDEDTINEEQVTIDVEQSEDDDDDEAPQTKRPRISSESSSSSSNSGTSPESS